MKDPAFLAFSLGPVQSFIHAARTVRDLWTGSYLLSWLTFHAMKPVLDRDGPSALVFPTVENHPLWKWSLGQLAPKQHSDELLTPCLPNRFLAHVPAEGAVELARQCEVACRTEWLKIAEKVRTTLHQQHGHPTLAAGESLWNRQVGCFFEVVTGVLPWKGCPAPVLRDLLADKSLPDDDARLWGARWQLVMKLLQARRSVRHFPSYSLSEEELDKVAQKCTLLGSFEHVGPGDRGAADKFWKSVASKWEHGGTRTGERERLCAVSLVKRFAWPDYFATNEVFNLPVKEKRYADTATIAASRWLKKAGLDPEHFREVYGDWSGQWLHWNRPDQDDDDRRIPNEKWEKVWRLVQDKKREMKQKGEGHPPAYLAVLSMDADRIGDLLARVTDSTVHSQISATLAHFSLECVRGIVEGQDGELIYAGGDDILALLPTETALACAAALNKAFHDNWKIPGQVAATVSAGLAIVHYKEDLRFALDQAHQAEKAAKASGRNALQLTICRRSGEHSTAFCPWDFVPRVVGWVEAFLKKASDRWAYRLRSELDTLTGLDLAAVAAEVRRQVGRAEEQTRALLGSPEAIAQNMQTYCGTRSDFPAALGDFVTLCQSASFLARGRDA